MQLVEHFSYYLCSMQITSMASEGHVPGSSHCCILLVSIFACSVRRPCIVFSFSASYSSHSDTTCTLNQQPHYETRAHTATCAQHNAGTLHERASVLARCSLISLPRSAPSAPLRVHLVHSSGSPCTHMPPYNIYTYRHRASTITHAQNYHSVIRHQYLVPLSFTLVRK